MGCNHRNEILPIDTYKAYRKEASILPIHDLYSVFLEIKLKSAFATADLQ